MATQNLERPQSSQLAVPEVLSKAPYFEEPRGTLAMTKGVEMFQNASSLCVRSLQCCVSLLPKVIRDTPALALKKQKHTSYSFQLSPN